MLAPRIQQYLRSVVEREREPVAAGAFVLYVHPTSAHPYLNYAIPLPDAHADDGATLVEVARERGLVPRLEYLDGCFPWVEESLAATGFTREARLRLMTCRPAELMACDARVDLVRVEPASELVRPMLTVRHGAFGEPAPSDDEVEGWDGRAVAAVSGGSVLGAAGWTAVIDGMSEIVGVGVAENARGQGVGAALTAAATRCAFAEGASLALLTPGDDNTARVYERAGFKDTTTMIHLSREPEQ
jgi:GNAT superfamily N-acetyltransferase